MPTEHLFHTGGEAAAGGETKPGTKEPEVDVLKQQLDELRRQVEAIARNKS